jgi:hypothetical protein
MSPIQNTQRHEALRTNACATKEPKIDMGAILNSVQASPTERYLFGTSSEIPAYCKVNEVPRNGLTATKIIPVPKPPIVDAAMTVPRLFAVPPTIFCQESSDG